MLRILLTLTLLLVLLSPVEAATVEAFLSPDNSFQVLQNFISDDLYIATYTFTDAYIMDELIKVKNVTLLIERSPVGGLVGKEVLCEMQKNNISIFLYDGDGFMHAKYIVKDGDVLISSENLGYSGFPKYSYGNRGWGAIVHDEKIAKEFMDIFNEDLKKSVHFDCNLTDYEISYDKIIGEAVFESKTYEGSARAIFAPNAIDPVLGLISSANKSIYIEQFYIYRQWGDKPNAFLESVIDKARQGVDVKILMDSTWYNIDKSDENSNFYTAEYVNEIARTENLTMEAKLVDLDKLGFEKVHNKGMIVDESTVLISTINWNEYSPLRNREVGIMIEGASARYFVDAFNYDWLDGKTDEKRDFTVGIETVLGIAIALIVILVARRK